MLISARIALRLPGGESWAIKIKRTTAPKVSHGCHLAIADIKADRPIFVFAGDRDGPLGDAMHAMLFEAAVEHLSQQT